MSYVSCLSYGFEAKEYGNKCQEEELNVRGFLEHKYVPGIYGYRHALNGIVHVLMYFSNAVIKIFFRARK